MPELPEVETIKRGLAAKIIGLNIKSVQVLNPKTFQPFDSAPNQMVQGSAQGLRGKPSDVEGMRVVGIWRRAKMLGIDLTTDYGLQSTAKQKSGSQKSVDDKQSLPLLRKGRLTLLFHLKMSGQLIFIPKGEGSSLIDQGKIFAGGHPTPDMRDEMPNKSTRVIFTFSDGGILYFNDQRKFGWVKVVDSLQLSDNSSLKGLGPEPLEKDFTWQVLKERVGKHKTWAIKVGLMDQQAIAGVGNIYASEACFNAKLDPRNKVNELSDGEWKKLHTGLIKALEDGIKHGGSSRSHFVNAEGEKGLFLDYAFVYHREGEKCKVCGTEIERIQQAGRSTFYCPTCQK